MPTSTIMKSSNINSTTQMLNNNHAGVQQNPPLTKAQLQNTMAGTRTVKNLKEIEQLLRDYPAALELYRTGKYKVKVKCEADIERVILVEKRSHKADSENISTTGVSATEKTEHFTTNSNQADLGEKPVEHTKRDISQTRTRSRTISKDYTPTAVTSDGNNGGVHTTAVSSMHMSSNAQPKVDNHRKLSKDRDISVNSHVQSLQQTGQQQPLAIVPKVQNNRRSQSRDDVSHASYNKVSHRKSKRDAEKMVVPFIPNTNPMFNPWNQPRSMQPYFSNPVLTQAQNNVYMPTYLSTQNQYFTQPYQYGSQVNAPMSYPSTTNYLSQSTLNSSSNGNKTKANPSTKYSTLSRSAYNSNYGFGMAPTYSTYNSNPQTYRYPGIPQVYHSHMTGINQNYWTSKGSAPTSYHPSAYSESRRGSKNRTRSVDTGHHTRSSAHTRPTQHKKAPSVAPFSDHQHIPAQTNIPMNKNVPMTEIQNDFHHASKLQASNGQTSIEKLTIRQLNDIFIQSDSSGRLPYGSIPNILQRFGINLTENDLVNAAKELDYNVVDPISARRLIHVLVKLGKIAKSSNQAARPPVSPTMLPEDREVTDILNQRQSQNHGIYSSAFPHPWK